MNSLEKDFEKLVAEHKGTIYTVCYMFAKRSAEADDLFQEVLINLWKGYSSFEGRSDVATWIWRVSLNTCISSERKATSRYRTELAMKQNLYEDNDADSKQIRKLYARIRQLKPFDRAIVLLWLEDLSYDEIASIVGISVKNVSVRLVRIREQLKNMSNEE
ncbi:MAG: sigma-70 family RNA polymerase sigma factor [Alistipes sp.]|nr:sigma-70 family RNA polymerase sigma factor [Alistipes sp.]